MKNNHSAILNLTVVAMSVALLTVCSWISIPALGPFVPFTLQTFAIFVIGGLFDLKCSLSSVVVYMLLGAVGVPVFAGFKSGFSALVGSTGGYIVGFVFTILIIQLFKHLKKESYLFMTIGIVIGLAVCYAFGTAWFYYVYTGGGNSTTVGGVLAMCVFPFLIPDALKIALAVFVVNRLQIPLRKMGFSFAQASAE